MKLPELDIPLAHQITTITATSTSRSERIQSPTSNSINLTSQINLPLLPTPEPQQKETINNPILKHRKATSVSSLNSIISLNGISFNNNNSHANQFTLIHNELNNLSRFLKELQPWMPFIIWAIFSIITLCIFLGYHTEILTILDKFAHLVKSMGISGGLIFYLMIFLTTFPLVIGYSTLITLSGFTFGISVGFLISYMAALTGAITVFCLSRKWFRKSVRRALHKNKSIGAVITAVEKKGFKLLFLIRLAPYPYNVLNTLLSATHLSLKTFIGATALSLFKLMIHVWIGSKLSSLSAYYALKETNDFSINNNNNNQEVLKAIIMIIGISIGIGVIIYVWISARKAINEVEQEQGVSLSLDGGDDCIDDNKKVEEEMEMLTNNNNLTTIRHRRGSSFCQVDFVIDNLFISNEKMDEHNEVEKGDEHSNHKGIRSIDVIEEENTD
ncbi:11007_t:CDS:2 [Funneliformis geosporum]|uniref:Golgi apparatus membrane protein TVP38 n=1 Tax=Funneliformis geosporum TaxID=1117311 RepID=A0A9W4WP14_9GLOM|nr:11007_t:CDS:2 [Funneliformis geosporum]CAI2176237.1 5217_t:CDS:2 [Funneliformis geosporum]